MALILSLIVTMLIAGLVVGYLSMSTANLQLTNSAQDTLQALHVAETGLARAWHELSADNMAAFADISTATCPSDEDGDGVPCGAAVVEDHREGTKIFYRFPCGHGPGLLVEDTASPASTGVYLGTYEEEFIGRGGAPITAETGVFAVMYVEIVAGERAKLISTGRYRDKTRAIEVTLAKPSPDTPPSFSLYAMLADGSIVYGGSGDTEGDIHTNHDLTIRGNGHSVEPATIPGTNPPQYYMADTDGDGIGDTQLYTGKVTASGSADTANAAGGTESGVDLVPIPEFTPQQIIDYCNANGIPITEYGSSPNLDGQALNGLVIVNGDLQLSGNISGDAMLIVTGDFRITGGAQIGTPDTTANLMVWVGGDITKQAGHSSIYGMIWAQGDVSFRGTADIYGSVITKSTSDVLGNVGLHFVPPGDFLTPLLNVFDPPKWVAKSWRECGEGGVNVRLDGDDGTGASLD
ncbi:MAG: hypothetical protein GXP25_10145 [Planctomycetes bacterium]|nr:hypothetical protein [Planctomycetota bacterium]